MILCSRTILRSGRDGPKVPYLELVPESVPPPAVAKRLQSNLAAATKEELVVLVGCLASGSERLPARIERDPRY